MSPYISVIPIAISSLFTLVGLALIYRIHRHSTQKTKTSELSLLIQQGIMAFHKRAVSAVLQIIMYVAILLYVVSFIFNKPFSWEQMGAFALGSIALTLSTLIATQYGPKLCPKIITLSQKRLEEGLSALFTSSNGIGFLITGSVLTGLLLVKVLLGKDTIIGYGLGVAVSGFFLRIGGGMFKTATDIGSDIIGKIEKDLPASDPRNPASILDIVGDFIGDIIGFSSDILGSFIVVIISTIFFAHTAFITGLIDSDTSEKLIQLPIWIMISSLGASVISFLFSSVRIKMKAIQNILLEGLYVAIILCGVATYVIIQCLDIQSATIPHLFWSYLVGLIGAIFVGYTSERLTSNLFLSTRKIASQAEYGPTLTTFNGLSIGLKGNGIFALYISIIALASFWLSGLYGIAMSALGMLSTTSLIISMNMFTPLASNNKKVQAMTQDHETTKTNIQKIHAIGETTAAVGNGFASGAAVLSSICLLLSLNNLVQHQILTPYIIIIGTIIGLILPYTISGFLLSDLVKNVINTISEARRQFKDIPYLFENKARPDIIKASDEQSRIAMDSLVIPGILMVGVPIVLGYIVGPSILIGIALGVFASCACQSFVLVSTGETLHNAKLYIQNGRYGGKSGTSFANISIADNFGDSQKDLLNPMMTIMMKTVIIIILLITRQLLL